MTTDHPRTPGRVLELLADILKHQTTTPMIKSVEAVRSERLIAQALVLTFADGESWTIAAMPLQVEADGWPILAEASKLPPGDARRASLLHAVEGSLTPRRDACLDCGAPYPCTVCGQHFCTDECGACGGGCQCYCFCPTTREY